MLNRETNRVSFSYSIFISPINSLFILKIIHLGNLHRFPLLTHSPSKPTALHINLLIPFYYIPLVNIPVGLQKTT